jgi:hypothetical protein
MIFVVESDKDEHIQADCIQITDVTKWSAVIMLFLLSVVE